MRRNKDGLEAICGHLLGLRQNIPSQAVESCRDDSHSCTRIQCKQGPAPNQGWKAKGMSVKSGVFKVYWDIVWISQEYGTGYVKCPHVTSYIMAETWIGPTPAEESTARKWKLKQHPQKWTKQQGNAACWQFTRQQILNKFTFPVVVYECESWTIKKAERRRIDAFELWCWRRLESPLDCKEIQPVHPKGDQSWVFIGRTDVEAETLILWPPDAKS